MIAQTIPFHLREIAESVIERKEERELMSAALIVYDNLDDLERDKITGMARAIVRKVAQASPYTQFNFYDALEILAKLGIFLLREGIKSGEPSGG